ncbi:MAG: class I SAM-dependent methyltransferase [Planctomycetes bacterium]|nr:class I SAM-dependent methyltransferase [Planctomycetota bacterium]
MPYQSHPFAQTHPDRLATVSTLLGLPTAQPHRSRVLELGCASGGNIIPMAESMPEATFLGIDRSARQVEEGSRCVTALGLTNIELRQQDVLDISPDLGEFDYIICHGVYSWVPRAVQDKILAICKGHLAPTGVAYVSYNTLPGWHLRGMVRDMMLFHTEQFETPSEQATHARALLAFLTRAVEKENTPYSGVLKSELASLQRHADYYLLHEQLEEHNEPLYFREFARRAGAAGLRYLAEADIQTMVPSHFPPDVAEVLQRVSADLIHLEQYMDFLRNRTFRQTLLCHADREPDYHLSGERVSQFHLAAQLERTVSPSDAPPPSHPQFRSPSGLTIGSAEPIVSAVLEILSESWPRSVPFPDLISRARARLRGTAILARQQLADEAKHLGRCLLEFHLAAPRLLDLRVRPTLGTTTVSTRPETGRLAKWQAERGNRVTNLRHELVELDEFGREVIRRLNGATDRAALLRGLVEKVRAGDFTVQKDGQVVSDPVILESVLRDSLDQQLQTFAKQSLLVK